MPPNFRLGGRNLNIVRNVGEDYTPVCRQTFQVPACGTSDVPRSSRMSSNMAPQSSVPAPDSPRSSQTPPPSGTQGDLELELLGLANSLYNLGTTVINDSTKERDKPGGGKQVGLRVWVNLYVPNPGKGQTNYTGIMLFNTLQRLTIWPSIYRL